LQVANPLIHTINHSLNNVANIRKKGRSAIWQTGLAGAP
jgi:hypothetical protein